MQDLQDLREAVYQGANCTSHPRTSTATQVRHHPHTPNLSTSSRLYHSQTLLTPPDALPRSNSDSSLHQNLVQGKMVVNNRKGALAFLAFAHAILFQKDKNYLVVIPHSFPVFRSILWVGLNTYWLFLLLFDLTESLVLMFFFFLSFFFLRFFNVGDVCEYDFLLFEC